MKKSLILSSILATFLLSQALVFAGLKDVTDPGEIPELVTSALDSGASVDQIMTDVMANPQGESLADDVLCVLFTEASERNMSIDEVVGAALNAGVSARTILRGDCCGLGSLVFCGLFSNGVPEEDVIEAASNNNISSDTVALARTACGVADVQAYTPPEAPPQYTPLVGALPVGKVPGESFASKSTP
ncbi:MAG: hypothetical protein BWK76_05880 [Desulfobulbaceae bacterium A2]|nr:MAG: hypothetical protein BWK76_05880 [Desulfobulbaceae bacterium A2]